MHLDLLVPSIQFSVLLGNKLSVIPISYTISLCLSVHICCKKPLAVPDKPAAAKRLRATQTSRQYHVVCPQPTVSIQPLAGYPIT